MKLKNIDPLAACERLEEEVAGANPDRLSSGDMLELALRLLGNLPARTDPHERTQQRALALIRLVQDREGWA